MASPRRYSTIFLAIPAESRNACASNVSFCFEFMAASGRKVQFSEVILQAAGASRSQTAAAGFLIGTQRKYSARRDPGITVMASEDVRPAIDPSLQAGVVLERPRLKLHRRSFDVLLISDRAAV